jgi:phenylalanine-4-hydroxylase
LDVYDNGVDTRAAKPGSAGNYAEEDHNTWRRLWERQLPLVGPVACREFHEGMPKLALSQTRLPERDMTAQHIYGLTGWTLADAQNAYLGPTEWFEHLEARRFPVTDYIRRPHELDFTPLPDLFHEYFGHLAFFTDQQFADVAQYFGVVYRRARTEEQQLAISRIWWYSTEFGFIRQDGELKVLGAGLLSSPGELQHALKPERPKLPFDVRQVAQTPGAAYSYHEQYFVVDSIAHIRELLDQYATIEGLTA